MDGSTTESALARIDAALARIEAVASRPRPGGDAGDGELAAKHERLRAAVTHSLHQIDRLIAGQQS